MSPIVYFLLYVFIATFIPHFTEPIALQKDKNFALQLFQSRSLARVKRQFGGCCCCRLICCCCCCIGRKRRSLEFLHHIAIEKKSLLRR
uniref:Cysteine-rich transmembrane CYSTM domain-containing protein n=1 Tax=Ascaris lumbricoides TaxID=6252 RepID=A0A9J2PPE7_ASCLU